MNQSLLKFRFEMIHSSIYFIQRSGYFDNIDTAISADFNTALYQYLVYCIK